MELAHWMFDNNKTCRQIGIDLDMSAQHIQNVRARRAVASRKLCRKLIEYTKGIVTLRDLRPDLADQEEENQRKKNENRSS